MSMPPYTRRSFIGRMGAGAAALAVGSRLASSSRAQTSAPDYATSSDSGSDPTRISAVRLAQLIREKQISSVDAVQAFYRRIDEVNPKINAVVAFCRSRALAEAQEADRALAGGKILGPLHGVPFTIKDSFDTAGIVTTGGTLGRKGFVPGQDATVVARVRAAGGILLGKTNTPEFTLGGGGKGTVNLVYGLTKNPYNLDYQPSGSSGGAGAIVACGGSAFDIGSDYGGSIRGPAYANGIAGIKPTLGRDSRWGHIVGYGGPFDSFQETGPLARRVEDLYLILSLIQGPDGHDAEMAPVPLIDPKSVDLKRLRVAYYTTNGMVDPTPEVQASVRQTVAYFTDLGCTVTEDRPPKWKEQGEIRQKFEGADGREHVRALLKKWNTLEASPGLSVTGEVLPAAEFTALAEKLDATRSEQLSWVEKYDLIIAPASDQPPIRLDYERPKDRPMGGASYTSIYNTNGWPAGVVRVATSQSGGLPIGVQAVAQPWHDEVVLAALSHIESRSGGWQRPPI